MLLVSLVSNFDGNKAPISQSFGHFYRKKTIAVTAPFAYFLFNQKFEQKIGMTEIKVIPLENLMDKV